jgi:hypothetical protein
MHLVAVEEVAGVWRLIYLIAAMVSLYLNVLVLIVQSFLKIEPLRGACADPN